jgi:hypothetical protein
MLKMKIIKFQINDPSLESQWRAIILFGKNSATYKFAFAKSLLQLAEQDKSFIRLEDLAIPYARHIIEHLKQNDKQGNSTSSKFLNGCRDFINGKINEPQLHRLTEQYGFINVVDAFHIVNGDSVPNPFYVKSSQNKNKELVITDSLFKLKE